MNKPLFWRRPPLFFRIFTVMLAAVIGAQVLNFALVLMVRLPEPRVYLLSEIADALRTGTRSQVLTVAIATAPDIGSQDERDLRVGRELATVAGVRPGDVRLQISRPPGIGERKDIHDRKVSLFTKPIGTNEAAGTLHTDMIVGRFQAALRLPDGRWRIARPAATGIEPWQWQVLLWLLGAALLVMPIAWFIARRIAAPVDLFANAAERLGRDPSAPPLSLGGPPEIAAAAEAFNAMQERLQRYIEGRTTMVAAIAHDLRTPLMRLSVLLDNVPDSTRSAAEAEIREMRSRIATIMSFMKEVSARPKRQRLNLASLIESVVDEALDSGGRVRIDVLPDIVVDADVAGMRAMLTNLMENVTLYGRAAQVSLVRSGDHAIVTIVDQGPGIPEADLDRVFEPFYRVEGSRSRETGGSGLGLASARAVARAHGGDIWLSNQPTGGLRVCVELPA